MDESSRFPDEIIKIVSAAMEGRMYGSVEIYFEEGRVTQITQRIIKKINRQKNSVRISIREGVKTNANINESSSIKFTT